MPVGKTRQQNREVARHRAPGEARVIAFNPDVHPGLIKRLLLVGHSLERVATAIGVRVETLKNWIAEREDLQELVIGGMDLADAEVLESLYDQAVGWVDVDEHGNRRRRGASTQAAIFWVKARLKLSDEPAKGEDPPLTPGQLEQIASEFLRRAGVDVSRLPKQAETIEATKYEEFD